MRPILLHLVRLALVFVFGVSLSSAFNYVLVSNNYFAGMGSVASANNSPSFTAEAHQEEAALSGLYEGGLTGLAPAPSPRPGSAEITDIVEDTASDDDSAVQRDVKVSAKRGDTLLSFLRRGGISANEAYEISLVLDKTVKASSIKTGQKMEVSLERSSQNPDELLFKSLKMLYPEREVSLVREAGGKLVSSTNEKKLTREIVRAGGTIHHSLMGVAEDIGIPSNVMQSVINAYSYDVDFQREIQEGDKFEVVYEAMQDDEGRHVRSGEVLYAQLILSGSPKKIYYYTDSEGQGGFYTEDGKSVKRALLKTPINGARLSSGFGMRRHPVLGYSKMHRGVDFAAPTGTPIYAAGDGRIVEAGRKGSYGNYVRIRHNGEYSTAYAHTSRFAKGIKPGVRVKQGQVIAYVGTTGRSTGPHLHYEVIRGSGQINPMSIKSVSAVALTKRDMPRFRREQAKLQSTIASLPMTTQVAMAK